MIVRKLKKQGETKNTVQIKYPAKLFIQGRLVHDMFPDWFPNLRESRLPETHLIRKSKQEGKIIKEVSYQPKTVLSAHQGQYSVYARTTIDEANRKQHISVFNHSTPKQNDPNHRRGLVIQTF